MANDIEGLVERLRALAKRYEDTMGLTRDGVIRRIGVLHDALLDCADELQAEVEAAHAQGYAEAKEQAAGLIEDCANAEGEQDHRFIRQTLLLPVANAIRAMERDER